MKFGGLFSGIGGFELGLQRAGHEIAFMCEIDPFCRRVLAKNFPGIPIYEDIRTLTGDRLAADGITVDALCGGFPCQDISFAADAGAGLAGERSGLWREVPRLLREMHPRPRLLILENVAALLARGIADVLGDMAALGLDAEWHCIPASAVGALHPRDRLWIVAYAPEVFGSQQRGDQPRRLLSADGLLAFVFDQGRENHFAAWRAAESELDRTLHGVSDRVDRLGTMSNAVVPQIPEFIGRAVLQANLFKAAGTEGRDDG